MIPRSPKVELTVIGFIFGFMILTGISGEFDAKECGPGKALIPGDGLGYECVPESETFTDDVFFQAAMLFLNHLVVFGLGYRARTLVNRVRSDQEENFITDLFGSDGALHGI